MPKQVHIYLYRKSKGGIYEYAVFQRSENKDWWQGICGGVEGSESLEEAARREMFEEAGICVCSPLYMLESVSYLPANIFNKQVRQNWRDETIVIPMHHFAMEYDGEIILSKEHTKYSWLAFDIAQDLVFFHDQKTALWELNERLLKKCLLDMGGFVKKKQGDI